MKKLFAAAAAALIAAAASSNGIEEMSSIKIRAAGHEFTAKLTDNRSARAFAEMLRRGEVRVAMHDYGGFEKSGDLGARLPRTDEFMTAKPGDVILYQGRTIVIYYGVNTWSLTKLAEIEDPGGLKDKLGEGDVEVVFSPGED